MLLKYLSLCFLNLNKLFIPTYFELYLLLTVFLFFLLIKKQKLPIFKSDNVAIVLIIYINLD